MSTQNIFDSLKLDGKGLIPAIVQDYATNDVLMLGYMSPESLKLTLQDGKDWFYSRSRQKLWLKGETSGHFQEVKEIYLDCDMDTVLVKVQQVGNIACHTGSRSCFFRKVNISKGCYELPQPDIDENNP